MSEPVLSSETALVPVDDESLRRTWQPPAGFVGWLSTADHKQIGLRFFVTALVFLVLGGIESLVMRVQLARAGMELISPELYNELFTMHGTTMMFFFAVPILEGIGLYLVPLMIGARETAFPRMNAFAYWIYLFAGVALYTSFFLGAAPDTGWFSYPTLSLREYSPTRGVDVWALSITLLEFSALTIAISLIVTILKHRAPGMTIGRMPLFVWAYLVFAGMVVLAMPTLVLATIMLELDRSAGTHFFDPAGGGDPLLWQHLFWWFGHPEVYIIFIPAVGIMTAVVPSFTRREVVGYPAVALSLVAVGFISMWVWAHHMFATGMPRLALGFFSAATFIVALPSGVQIFAWLATVWSSRRLIFATPFLFGIGWVITFVFGGISGVTLASVPFDLQVHDTHYVVGHFHYVLVGGMVFPLLAGIFYWFPKVSGRMLSDSLGRASFWLSFIGLNLTFLPMHLSGFWGMPRRVYTYPSGLGLELPNLLSTIGAFVFALGIVLVLVNVAKSLRSGVPAGANPWGGNTLEWSVPSPPPAYNFRIIPSVRSRNPSWMQPELGASPSGEGDGEHDEPRIALELREDRRETPATRVLDAAPDARNVVAGTSILPLLAALAASIGILGAGIHIGFLLLGGVLGFIAIASWHWPEPLGGPVPVYGELPPQAAGSAGRPVVRIPAKELPVCHHGPQAPLWWGMILFILIEAVFFFALITSYYYLRGQAAEWPPGKTEPPELMIPVIYTIVLLLSSVAMWSGDHGIRKGNRRRLVAGQSMALLLAVVFLALKGYEYSTLITYKWYSHAYGSLTWTLSGFHSVHVMSVMLKGVVVLALGARGYFTEERRLGVEINGLYWHFVVLLWLPIFFTIYIAPHFL